MARSAYPTLLPIDEWARYVGIDPWTLNQWGVGFPEGSSVGINDGCGSVFYQHEWQNMPTANLSREEIGRTIMTSEDMIAKRLGFYPAPKFIYQELVQYPAPRTPYSWGSGAWSWGNGFPYALPKVPSVQLKFTKVLGGGILARTNIGDTANLTLSDSDGDTVLDLFTCSIATTITDVNEIGVYIRAADRVPVGAPISEMWRIRPVNVTISGGTATIMGHSAMLAKPNLQTIVNPQPLDVTDLTNYVDELTVERVYRDTTTDDAQGTAYWENRDCIDDNTPPCTLTEASICLGDRNGARGQVFVAFTEDECCTNWRAPDQVAVNYLAGEPLVNGVMNDEYAAMVAYLASGMMINQLCGCDRADRLINYWRTDVTQPPSDQGQARMLTPHEMLSPFGFTRGSLYAWNRIPENENFIGVSI